MPQHLEDKDFDKELNCSTDNVSIVVGHSTRCSRSRNLIKELDDKKVEYVLVDLRANPSFLRTAATKLNLTSVNMPMVLLYKDSKYVKRATKQTSVDDFVSEQKDL